jgi:hypothetical protein
MALPRISEVAFPQRPQPVQPADPSDRAGRYSIAELETLLQPLLVAAPKKRERIWLPAQTIAFAVTASALLWAVILIAAMTLF